MANTVAVGDLVELSVICRGADQNAFNVFHFEVDEIVGAATNDEQIAGVFSDKIHARYKAVLATVSEFVGVRAQIIRPIRRPAVGTIENAGLGTAGVELLPGQIAGEVSVYTALTGRSRRGRKYFPFPAEDDNEADNLPSVNYRDRLELLAVDCYSVITVSGGVGITTTLIPVIWSKKLMTTTPVTQVRVRRAWGTMRKRSSLGGSDPVAIP